MAARLPSVVLLCLRNDVPPPRLQQCSRKSRGKKSTLHANVPMKKLWSADSHERAPISLGNNLQSSNALFWSITCVTVGLAVIIGFFLHGGTHGLYMDDYSEKSWAFSFTEARWKLSLSPQFHI